MTKNKYKNALIALLAAIVGVQGFYIASGKTAAENAVRDGKKGLSVRKSPEKSAAEIAAKLEDKFLRDAEMTEDIFDDFFDDEFFGVSEDPFKEMEEIRKKLHEQFSSWNKNLFGRSWKRWYDGKFGESGMNMTREEKDGKLIMSFTIPGLQSNSVDVNINDKRISISCDIRKSEKQETDDGHYSSVSFSRFARILPLPEGVKAEKAEVETKGDKLIISLPKS